MENSKVVLAIDVVDASSKSWKNRSNELKNAIGDMLTKEKIICSDSHPSIIAWAKEKT